MRSLDVYLDHRRVGTLSEGDNLWQLRYDPAWVDAMDGFALAPGLPRSHEPIVDGATQRPVQWFFDNLLPEERLREAISKEAEIKGEDAFALLQYLGAESAGALTLLPPGTPVPSINELLPLSDAALSARIARIPKETLTRQAPKRMSLAGAQHKLLITVAQGQLYEPQGATASTHILKPGHPHPETYPASVMNEFLTMRMARAAGLSVPDVAIRYVPEPVYIVERFDRTFLGLDASVSGPPRLEVQRLHIIDACQLLNKDRLFKHKGASLDALNQIAAATTNRARTRIELFRWLVFNVLIANDDNHLKNLSFFVSKDGIALAPHYDLIATGVFSTKAVADDDATWPDVRMTIALEGAGTFAQVSRDALVRSGAKLGLNARTADRIVGEVVDKADALLALAQDELKAAHASRPEAAAASAASETRFVRVLEHIILRDMKRRLAREIPASAGQERADASPIPRPSDAE